MIRAKVSEPENGDFQVIPMEAGWRPFLIKSLSVKAYYEMVTEEDAVMGFETVEEIEAHYQRVSGFSVE